MLNMDDDSDDDCIAIVSSLTTLLLALLTEMREEGVGRGNGIVMNPRQNWDDEAVPEENEEEAPTDLGDDYGSNNVEETQTETPTDEVAGENTQAGRQKRPRRERGSSIGRNHDMFEDISVAMRSINVSLERKATVAERDSGYAKEARFRESMAEMYTIGVPPNLLPVAMTLIANNPGYKEMYMAIPRECRLDVVIHWLKEAGYLGGPGPQN